MIKEELNTLHCDYDQYALLLMCSEEGDIQYWNRWRHNNIHDEIWLEGAQLFDTNLIGAELFDANLNGAEFFNSDLSGADFEGSHLKGADFEGSVLEGTKFSKAHIKQANFARARLVQAEFYDAHLDGVDFSGAHMEEAILERAHLEGANLTRAHLEDTILILTHVDGRTTISQCYINQNTNFTGVGLDSATIDPRLKEALKNNIRRIQWKEWLDNEKIRRRGYRAAVVRSFWWLTDYGSSTERIIKAFIYLAVGFGVFYWLLSIIPGFESIIHELRQIGDDNPFDIFHTLVRSLYFSIVTMTTLGFGDMHAAQTGGWPSYLGYICLSVQVIIGYVLLGALITRLGIMFSGSGPSFSPEKQTEQSPEQLDTSNND